MRSRLIPLLAAALLAAPASAGAKPRLHEFVGSLHEHSSYSDGWPGSRPSDYYASARRHGLDFMAGSEHSDNTYIPVTASEYCEEPSLAVLDCVATDPDHLRKWDASQEQALAATDASFTAFRGFEWTSDRFGHINVYFSSNVVSAKNDGGYAAMLSLYSWATRPVSLGGGADGLLTFNHPGDKKLSTSDPGFNWDDFAYDASVDPQMVGVEVYNGDSDFANGKDHEQPPQGWYAHALDKGWHVGAIGAEDKGHKRTDDWGADNLAKTVMIARDRSAAALREAMVARHFYATLGRGARMTYTVDGAPMGTRLRRAAGDRLHVRATGLDREGTHLALDLVTNEGKVLATAADGTLDTRVPYAPPAAGAAADRWLFVRARRGTTVLAYSSPVWVQQR